MTHFFVGFASLAAWFLGVSAVLFAAFLVAEYVQHRALYRSDAWTEESLLEERIASGTLPTAMHVIAADQPAPSRQAERPAKQPVRNVPLVHNVVR